MSEVDEEYGLNILRPKPQRPSGEKLRLSPTTSIYPNADNFPAEQSSERGSEQPTPGTPHVDGSRGGGNISLADDSGLSANATPHLPLRNSSFDDPGGFAPQKTRSVLNLTSSTLFGIYSPTGYDAIRDEPSTPWGTGAQTPARSVSVEASRIDNQRSSPAGKRRESGATNKDRRQSLHQYDRTGKSRPKSVVGYYAAQFLRKTLLFAIGLAYGVVMRQLHNSRAIAPVRVHAMERPGWWYLGFWGLAGVVLGSALPWADKIFGRRNWSSDALSENRKEGKRQDGKEGLASDGQYLEVGSNRSGVGAEWNPIVRSIGAFVGIAFAIRKLPWQSTLQVSLTLALVNPVIWYLLDRSRTGFFLSTLVGIAGAALLLGINPDMVPSPAPTTIKPSAAHFANSTAFGIGSGQSTAEEDFLWGILSYETVGVATWISSVLFCSCVCFGNIGRRLAGRGLDTS